MESSLGLKRSDIEGEVAFFLGFGRGADNGDTAWTSRQTAAIEFCVRSGLRQFYFPPPLGGPGHDWSFLKPFGSFTLASGEKTAEMPDDFGGLIGMIHITDADDNRPYPVKIYNEGQIKAAYAIAPDASGAPMMAALQIPKKMDKLSSQRARLYFYPEADQAYDFECQYYLLPQALSGDQPYCYGGMAHVETILESCLAIAEQRLDDAQGVHTAKFMERLAASIDLDRRSKAQVLGYNHDRSDGRARYDRRWVHSLETVTTFDGVTPS